MAQEGGGSTVHRPLRCPYCGRYYARSHMTQHWDSMHPERFTLAGKVNVGCPWCPLRFDVEKPLAYLEHAGRMHREELDALAA